MKLVRFARRLVRLFVGVAVVGLWGLGSARANFDINVKFDDPNGVGSHYDELRASAVAAGQEWGRHFTGNTSINLVITFRDDAFHASTADATSAVENPNGVKFGDVFLLEQGVATKIRNQVSTHSLAPDAFINLAPSYISQTLYFDPHLGSGKPDIPGDRSDAYSVFLHEFGHVLAFNGDLDPTNGALPGNYQSTYDRYVHFNGSLVTFTGPKAMAVYGGPVPLEFDNYKHLGNHYPLPGYGLDHDVMFGPYFLPRRFAISPLDLAIVQDTDPRLPVIDPSAVPEPSSLVLFALGLGGLLLTGRQRLRGRLA